MFEEIRVKKALILGNEQVERIHELKEEYSKNDNQIISIDVKKSSQAISTGTGKSIVLRW